MKGRKQSMMTCKFPREREQKDNVLSEVPMKHGGGEDQQAQ